MREYTGEESAAVVAACRRRPRTAGTTITRGR